MSDYKLDYEKMFKQISARVEQILAEDDEYFALQRRTIELGEYTKTVSNNLLKLKKSDIIKILRLVVAQGELSKQLCEKYSLLEKEVINDGEEEDTTY